MAAREAAAAGLAQWAQGLATWAQWRLQVAASREADALQHIDAAHEWRRELNASLVQVREERDRLHDIRACLAEKEDELMRRESALQLVLEHPPHPFPFIDPDSPHSVYSPITPLFPRLLLPLIPRMTLTLWHDCPLRFTVHGFEKYKRVWGEQKARKI